MPEPLLFSEFDANSAVLHLSGEFDETSGAQLRDVIGEHSDGFSRSLTLNLSDVLFLPSFAVGVLATARQRATDAGVSLDMVAREGSIAQRVLVVCAMPHRTS